MLKRSFCRKQALRNLVSFSRASGFTSISKEEFVSTRLKEIPPTVVPAFVIPEVISATQEKLLLLLTDSLFTRHEFIDNHVDSLIHHYKEFYRSFDSLCHQKPLASREEEEIDHFLGTTKDPWLVEVLARPDGKETAKKEIRSALVNCQGLAQSFVPKVPLQDRLHFLQLHSSGFIRAHADETRNSSAIVAGVTLGSARVMTLTHPKYGDAKVDMLLAPRSMYLIVGTARTEWEHSVDWEKDDEEHNNRARALQSETDLQSPIVFDGSASGYIRGTRTALIFRGVSPMDLFAHQMQEKHQGGGNFDLFRNLRKKAPQ